MIVSRIPPKPTTTIYKKTLQLLMNDKILMMFKHEILPIIKHWNIFLWSIYRYRKNMKMKWNMKRKRESCKQEETFKCGWIKYDFFSTSEPQKVLMNIETINIGIIIFLIGFLVWVYTSGNEFRNTISSS